MCRQMSAPTPEGVALSPKAPGPSPVSKLFGAILARHSALFKELGYDEVDDFRNIPEPELSTLLSTLETRNVPPGHIGKIRRRIESLQSPSETSPPTPSVPKATPPSAPQETAIPAVPKPNVVQESQEPPLPLPSEPPQSAVNLADFPFATSFLHLVEAHGRTYYGRDDHSLKLSDWHHCMNKHVLALVRSKPQLLRKSGKEWKLGAYYQEASQLVRCDPDFNFVKSSGSHSKQIPSSSQTEPSSEDGSATKRSSQRQVVMNHDERTLRLAALPGLIKNKKEEARNLSHATHTLHTSTACASPPFACA